MWKVIDEYTGEVIAHSILTRKQARRIIRDIVQAAPPSKRHMIALAIVS